MLGGHMVWVGMSRGRFVGGRHVKVPKKHHISVHFTQYKVQDSKLRSTSVVRKKNLFWLLKNSTLNGESEHLSNLTRPF
jgi:hypothetical protein